MDKEEIKVKKNTDATVEPTGSVETNLTKPNKNSVKKPNKLQKLLLVIGGLFTGFAGGFFGGGGGMLSVPLLNKVLKLETKKSHATAMLIILPMSIVSGITYLLNGHFKLMPTMFTGGGVLAGGIAGALLLKKLNSFLVSIIFAVSMVGIGIWIIVKAC